MSSSTAARCGARPHRRGRLGHPGPVLVLRPARWWSSSVSRDILYAMYVRGGRRPAACPGSVRSGIPDRRRRRDSNGIGQLAADGRLLGPLPGRAADRPLPV